MAGPLRIVAYLDRYPPWANAGGEWALHHMLAPLAARGHDVDVVTGAYPEGMAAPSFVDGVGVWPEDPRANEVLAAADVLLGQLLYTRKAVDAAALSQVPLVYLMHNDMTIAHWSLVPANVTAVVYNSRWLHRATIDRYPQWGALPEVTVRPPIPYGTYHVDPHHSGSLPFDREFVTLVNMTPAKGAQLFYELADDRARDRFLAVEGNYGQQLRPRGRRNVEWQPNTPDIRDQVYARTRVLLVPSEYESFGRVAGEAMAAGIPVIAHPTPGLCECLGDVGLFADRRRPADWHALLDRLRDEAFYYQVSDAGLARAHDAERIAVGELLEFEGLLRLAAGADRGTVVRSLSMPTHDPRRGRKRGARRQDIGGAPVVPQEATPVTPPVQGASESERAAHEGVTDPAVLDMAAAMDAAAGSPGEFVKLEGGTLDIGGVTPEQAAAFAEDFDTTLHANTGAGGDGSAGQASLSGGQTTGVAEPEPAPTDKGDASAGAATTAPAEAEPAAPPRLVDDVPENATGDDGVAAWINAADSDAERYDRAEAAEWVEDHRPGDNRKTVTEAVTPILYD